MRPWNMLYRHIVGTFRCALGYPLPDKTIPLQSFWRGIVFRKMRYDSRWVNPGAHFRYGKIMIIVCRLIGDRCRVLHEQIDEELLKFIEVFIIHYDMTSQQGSQPKLLCPGIQQYSTFNMCQILISYSQSEFLNKSQVHPKLHKVIVMWGVETCS